MTSQTSSEHESWFLHAARQWKYVIPGALATYYIGVWEEFFRTLDGENGSLGRTGALGAAGLGLTTVTLFLYVILLRIIGREPDYRSWATSPGALSKVIPTMTGSIAFGWLVAVATLGQYSNLGYIKSVIGVTGVYALTFGILGLIPVPIAKHKS